MGKEYNDQYTDEYFKNRLFGDEKRLITFSKEAELIRKYIKQGTVCDVGCGTGEFLEYIKWIGDRFGMEVNEHAITTASKFKIGFDNNILNKENYFDIVIFRGTIQHIPHPFLYLEKAYYSLKKGGFIVFLSTPNANSIYYKIWNDLPMLNSQLNFYIPSDVTLCNALKNIGFEIKQVNYSYLKSPYSNVINDHFLFLMKFFKRDIKFPFWRNMMDIIAVKNYE